MKLIVLLSVSVFEQTASPAEPSSKEPKRANKPTKGTLTREYVMELHYKVWCGVADTLDAPTVDEVLAAFAFDYPQVAVEGFGWNEAIQPKAATMLQTRWDELLSQSGFGPTLPVRLPKRQQSHLILGKSSSKQWMLGPPRLQRASWKLQRKIK